MKYLFLDDEIWEKAYNELQQWIGTPYYYGVCVKNRGADCSSFLEAVGVLCGILEQKSDLRLPDDWFLHTQEQLLYENIKKTLENLREDISYLELDPPKDMQDILRGDLLCFSINSKFKVIHHLGVALDNKTFVHADDDRGIIVSEIKPYFRKIQKIIRLIKLY